MSIHVCQCVHNGKVEYHLRYPGMTREEAQELADKINAGGLGDPKKLKVPDSSLIDDATWLKQKG
jgi:hypothetical protein